jgi:hypothetical protein
MRLDAAALLPGEVFELASRGIESVAQRDARVAVDGLDLVVLAARFDVGVLLSPIERWDVIHDERGAAPDTELDSHVKATPAEAMMTMADFHQHAASRDAAMETLQPVHPLANVGLERIGVPETPKRDLNRCGRHHLLLRSIVDASRATSGRVEAASRGLSEALEYPWAPGIIPQQQVSTTVGDDATGCERSGLQRGWTRMGMPPELGTAVAPCQAATVVWQRCRGQCADRPGEATCVRRPTRAPTAGWREQ